MNPAECGPVNDLKSLGGRLDVDGRARRVSPTIQRRETYRSRAEVHIVVEIIGRLRVEQPVWGCGTIETSSSGEQGVRAFGTYLDVLTPFIAMPHCRLCNSSHFKHCLNHQALASHPRPHLVLNKNDPVRPRNTLYRHRHLRLPSSCQDKVKFNTRCTIMLHLKAPPLSIQT